MDQKNSKFVVAKVVPDGPMTADFFKLMEESIPQEKDLKDGEVLAQTISFAVEPYMRGILRGFDTYLPGLKVGDTMIAGGLFKIVHSKLQDFPVGSVVYGFGPSWCKYTILTRAQIMTNITSYPKEIHSAFLHTLGIAGLTAHHGLLHICTPKEGETVVISSASSTVAGLVAAIAKIKKLRVVGLTHSPKRVDELTQTGYFDAIVVSNTDMKTFSAALKQAAPKGVDIYFDNVGGEVSDEVVKQINNFGRVAICGAISQYNDVKGTEFGQRLYLLAIEKRLLVKGFVVTDHADKFAEMAADLAKWLQEKKIPSSKESIVKGLENAPQALVELYENKHHGKIIVQVSSE